MEEKMGFGLKRVERQAGEGGKGGALAVRGWLPLSRSLSSAPARPGRVAESPPPSPSLPAMKSRGAAGARALVRWLRGGARLSRGISPSPWPRAVVGRGRARVGGWARFGAPAAELGELGRRGVAWRGLSRSGRCSAAGEKGTAEKRGKAGAFW